MNILITGSTGQLGSSLYEYLTLKGESVTRFNRDDFSWISHQHNIDQFVLFDCIIHTAANTDVEGCELDPFSCYRDNALLTERLAYAACNANCKFIFISSTGIYGTEKTEEPYSEYDTVNPTTIHHRAKWFGELSVNKHVTNSLILRVGWLFGGKPNIQKNFVTRRIEEALDSSTGKIYSNNQQYGIPTFVNDLAVKIYEFLKRDEVGTFNVVNEGRASRYEYVSEIIDLCGIDVEVVPAKAENFNRKAKVSNNEVALTQKMQYLGYKPLPDWRDSLRLYIERDLGIWLQNKLL